MEIRKKVVLATACLFLAAITATAFYQQAQRMHPLALDMRGYPSIGSGEIELVVFEDLCCISCRTFSEEIFPQIAKEFLETGKARLTVIPVAFGEESKPIANAALAVYKMAPQRFIPFILELFKSKESGREHLLATAAKIGGIDAEKLTQCIDSQLYYQELDSNLTWATRLMGKEFGTPTLFVNGILTSTASFDALVHRVQQMETQK